MNDNEVKMVQLTVGEAQHLKNTLSDMREEIDGMADWGFPLTVLSAEVIDEAHKIIDSAIRTAKLQELFRAEALDNE